MKKEKMGDIVRECKNIVGVKDEKGKIESV